MKLLILPAAGLAALCPILLAQPQVAEPVGAGHVALAVTSIESIPAQAVFVADAIPATPERKDIRIRRIDGGPLEKETVTFLGVATGPVSPTLIAQLGLPNGTGLVVSHVAPDSPAAAVLKEHDILLKLDDQILIDPHQMSVLVRNHKEGDEVTLTYVRGGKQGTTKVKLIQREVPRVRDVFRTIPGPAGDVGGGRIGVRSIPAQPDREDADNLLSMIEREHRGLSAVRLDDRRGWYRVNTIPGANRSFVYADDDGTVEYTVTPKEKTLVAKDTTGKQLFSGPVTTEEQRKALSPEIRKRLERVESMQGVTFRTDDDFKSSETRILEPEGQPIAYPGERGAKSGDGLRTL